MESPGSRVKGAARFGVIGCDPIEAAYSDERGIKVYRQWFIK
jgi:hypothetical protein